MKPTASHPAGVMRSGVWKKPSAAASTARKATEASIAKAPTTSAEYFCK
jgi:hypothetical protein